MAAAGVRVPMPAVAQDVRGAACAGAGWLWRWPHGTADHRWRTYSRRLVGAGPIREGGTPGHIVASIAEAKEEIQKQSRRIRSSKAVIAGIGAIKNDAVACAVDVKLIFITVKSISAH